MADLANLVLAVDSTAVPKATASLDGLTAAGARAEAATAGLGRGFKGVGVEASAMAVGAQAAARAAMDQAAGFKTSEAAIRLNTMAMRETLVVARELSRGNFTRIPGSLTLLAQGIGSQGGFGSYASALATQFGLIKKVQDAELAEAAAAASAGAAGVRAAAEKAAANVMAADTEIALAEAQVRVTEGTAAEAVAQARLAAAHEAVGAAAAQAAVAENALAVAMGREAEAQTAASAATRTLIGGAGFGLIGIGAVAGVAYGAMKQLQGQIKDDGTLTTFRDNLGLTHQEMLRLSDGTEKVSKGIKELSDVAPTLGDVMHGVFGEIAREANNGTAWNQLKTHASNAFIGVLDIWNKVSAALSAGMWTLGDIAKNVFQYIAQQIGASFYSGVNKAIDAINGLNAKIPKWAGGGDANLIPHLKADPSVATFGGLLSTSRREADANYASALAQNQRAYAGIRADTIQSAESRMQREANAIKDNRRAKKPKNKKPNDHGLQEALDKLNAEIKGQYALADAYQVSDAAAMKATAQQKAEEDAISHKSKAGVFYELELQKAVATRAAEGGKVIGDLKAQTAAQNEVNAKVAAGVIPASQMSAQLQLEAKLRPLIAAYEVADAAHKGQLAAEIKNLTKAENDHNAAVERGKALSEIAANDNEIERLQLEAKLIGASNAERAVAIAQLEQMQKLKDMPGLTRDQQATLMSQAAQKAQLSVQSPWQQWAASVPNDAKAITDALQSIEFRGFDNLASSIAGVITGTKSLGQAFKDIANQIIGDIVQMTVKMLIFRAISGIFGGGSISAPSGGPVAFSALNTGVLPSLPGGFGGPRASGGPVGAGQTYLVGERGPEFFRPSASGTIIPNGASNNNQQGPVEVVVHVRTDENFHADVQQIAGQIVVAAAPTIVKAATQTTLAAASRKTLNGVRG